MSLHRKNTSRARKKRVMQVVIVVVISQFKCGEKRDFREAERGRSVKS